MFSVTSFAVVSFWGFRSGGLRSSMSTTSEPFSPLLPSLLKMTVKFSLFASCVIFFISLSDCVFTTAFTVGYCCFRKMCSNEYT